MPPKFLEVPALSEVLQRRLQALPSLPLVVLDSDPGWLSHLKNGDRSLNWPLLQMDPQTEWLDRLQQHPQLRTGGWIWSPGEIRLPPLPHGWRQLAPPWSVLGRWLLKAQNLKARHVGLLAPPEAALEGLVGWLMRQGASLTWCDERSRHLGSQLRLCDVIVVFPGFQAELEAYQLSAGGILIDLRPGAAGLSGSALQATLQGYCDASRGALHMLLPCLAQSALGPGGLF
ncbi:hypothetical protein JST97_14585 [bacterium]|nr:hypothetical protein [bacterium]